ncbi:hypothetical protein [Chondromyces apiculatus]|uniref:hypothetical protein n=1 Tax=Chondromyces apiculatus TaxID=51 RepID=UPI0009DEC5B3|nr:hypothetical protein [Chondromyces apiculatus]
MIVEAAVLRRGARSARVRVLATGEEITVRARDLWHVMPGHVVTLALSRRWRQRGHHYAAGEVREARIDVAALGLPPLGVLARGPLLVDATRERMATEQERAMTASLRALLAKSEAPGRVSWEMAEVPARVRREDGDEEDPILASLERKRGGDLAGAVRVLMDLVAREVRCLDAHAHLGNLVFPSYPEHALLHYEIGVALGDHALPPGFTGALPWQIGSNRPFLRCLHGKGLSLWRLGRRDEAARVFERLLWLNPRDEQGAARCFLDIEAGRAWEAI